MGTGSGSHGRTMTVSSQTGAREAPARASAITAAPARNAAAIAKGESGSNPMRAPSRPPTASVLCDSHAATAARSVAAGKPSSVAAGKRGRVM